MRTLAPSIENRLAEHHRGLPVWIRAPKTGQEYYTGLTRAKLKAARPSPAREQRKSAHAKS